MNCLCHSGLSLQHCCGRFISGESFAQTAEQLMRSRYCAYAMQRRDYLLDSWHSDFRPDDLQLENLTRWIGLQIIDASEQQDCAVVEFEASLLIDNKVELMHERSNFLREQGKWLYTSGTMLAPTIKPWSPSRNERCPCGSGQKFKRCCLTR